MPRCLRLPCALAVLAAGLASLPPAGAQGAAAVQPGDHIVAVVNSELVTAVELERRVGMLQSAATRRGEARVAAETMRKDALDSLIEERVLVTHARDAGWRVEEGDVDRAVQSVAAQNQMSLEQLRRRLAADGVDLTRFRATLRDQILVERTREREVLARIVVSEDDVDREIAAQRAAAREDAEVNIAQILVPVPEGADEATVAQRRDRAAAALARVRAGEAFAEVAREVSEDANRERGGEIGAKPLSRLPDLFVQATRSLKVGEVSAEPLRSGAGFHVLKVLERREASLPRVVETRARHILLRTSEQAPPEGAVRRLDELRRQIVGGQRRFEDLAREVSEDGSAVQGGDLGWFGPGVMVPEFEQPLGRLAVGDVSQPVLTRFGAHLIQVLDRREVEVELKQYREQVRNVLRERKFEQAYEEWTRELRARAYVEVRDASLR